MRLVPERAPTAHGMPAAAARLHADRGQQVGQAAEQGAGPLPPHRGPDTRRRGRPGRGRLLHADANLRGSRPDTPCGFPPSCTVAAPMAGALRAACVRSCKCSCRCRRCTLTPVFLPENPTAPVLQTSQAWIVVN